MKGVKIIKTIIINDTVARVFDFTQDYTSRLSWDTFLKKAILMNGAMYASKGVKAYCVAKNGLGMVTEYVSFNRPDVAAIKMTKGPYLFKTFAGSWTFKQTEAGKTTVVFLYLFTFRFPFNIAACFIKKSLEKNVQQRLFDLKKTIEAKDRS